MFTWEKWSDDCGYYTFRGYAYGTGVRDVDDRIKTALVDSELIRQTEFVAYDGEQPYQYQYTPMAAWLAATDLIIAGCSNDEAVSILREGPAAFERFEALFALARA